MKYPKQYLHVRENRSGQEWIVPFRSNAHLDIEKMCKKWVKEEFFGELAVDLPFCDGPEKSCSDYYARIITDGRPPDSVVCWDSTGFFIRSTY